MSDSKIRINLKALRQEAGLSLARTAELTGVSKAMLGQIERGESSPTVATLWKLAKGFHLPLTALLEEVGDMPRLSAPARGIPEEVTGSIGIRTVFPFDPRLGSETFVVTLAPGQTHLSQAHDTGVVEDVFALRGGIEVLIGDDWRACAQGEGLRLAADVPHGYRNRGGAAAEFHNTIHYPRRTGTGTAP
ncbi:helix-turn-helix domain-containing protein [Celeribacter indicus]|uniref:Puttative helix-turn-helix protein n=1 Tax=Celeribacter indicus TaxID=1208324 RepID=A0A0B5E6J8_9RHOB|nr:XRE family transcriptional regulator [Celeribacter indicus]AJE47942.1 puttative helix-turn-helix protein [Celeribacter indicus]SDW27501.1 transcriptional regulator, XRE family with cupin sensor [Celeribacter indicus]